MKQKDSAFVESPFPFCNFGRINMSVPRARGSTSMKLSLQNKRYRFLMHPAEVPQLITPEKIADLFEITNAADSTHSSEEARRATEMLRKAMNSVCYKYVIDYRKL